MATIEDLLIRIGIDSKKAKSGAEGLKKDLSKTWDVAKTGAAAGGALVGAALMGGIASMIESSKPVALLQAQLGATGDFAESMGKNAGDLYNRGVVGSMEEAAGAIKAVWQNNLVPEDALDSEIEAVGAKLTTLAAISEDEAGNVANAVKQMMRNGLVKNADEAMDLLVKGVQNGVNKSGDLFDTFNEYGTQFRKLGLDGAESMGLMSQAIKGGARDADTAADALKEFSIRAIDGSKTSAAGFEALGLNAQKMTAQIAKGGPEAKAGLDTVLDGLRNMKDPVKQNAAAVALFGTKAEDLGASLFDMDLDGAASGLGNVAGAADAAGQTLEQSAGAKLESFKRKALAGVTEELAKWIPAIEKTFGWLQQNSAWVKPLAIGLGALAVVIGVITAVQWAWNAALAVSPVTWIVLGIIALIAVIVLVATKTRFFQTIWEAVWGFMKKVGAWFAGPFANFFVTLWNKLTASLGRAKAQFMTIVNAIVGYYRFWWNVGGSIINAVISGWGKLVSFVKGVPGKIRKSLTSMWDGLKSGFKSAINWVIGKWNSLQFSIPSFTVLGKTFGGGTIGVPKLPMLAEGGITTGPTLAMIGEGREQEVVAPLSKVPDLAGDRDPLVIIIRGDDTESSRYALSMLRTAVKDRGGNVQSVVGQKGR